MNYNILCTYTISENNKCMKKKLIKILNYLYPFCFVFWDKG